MNLKTSFCNTTVIKSDFKRLWWVSALHTLALFLTSVYSFIERYYNGIMGVTISETGEKFAQSDLYRYTTTFYVLALIIPVFLGVFLFAYLQKGKTSTFAHSVPVLRKTHYISHFISGIIMFMLPIIINSVILLLMRFDSGFAQTFKVSHLLTAVGISSLYSLLAFSGSVVVSMITANTVASAIFTYVFAFLPIVCEAFVSYFLPTQLFGYPEGEFLMLENLYFSPTQLLEFSNTALYLAIAIVFIFAGYLLYKARNLENHSEVVAFPLLRPVFIYGAGITLGCIGFAYFNSLWNVSSALALIPLGILGIVIATMIVRKSFRIVSAVYKPVIIYSVAILALFGILKFDLTGYETRVPAYDKVVGVEFNINYMDTFPRYSTDGERVYPAKEFKPYITDKSVIENVTNLHSKLVKNGETEPSYPSERVTLEYTLANGRTLKRRYDVNFAENEKLLTPIFESDVLRSAYFPILRNGERIYEGILLQDKRYENDKIIDPAIYDELLNALKADLKAVSFSEFGGKTDTIAQLRLTFKEASLYQNGKKVPSDYLNGNTETYNIRRCYLNTISVLEKHGLWTPYPTADDVLKIGVFAVKVYRNTESAITAEVRSIDGTEYDFVIDDQSDVKEVFEYCENQKWIHSYGLDLVFYLKDGTSYRMEVDAESPNLPKCIKDNI